MRGSLGWIIATTTKRVTAHDSPSPLEYPAHEAVFVDSLDHVLTAAWMKSAVFGKQRRNGSLVKANHSDRKLGRKLDKPLNHGLLAF